MCSLEVRPHLWAAEMSLFALPIQPALGAWLCCGPAPLRPICLHRGAGEVSLVAQVQGVVFDLNMYIPDSGMEKVLQRKYHIQGWGGTFAVPKSLYASAAISLSTHDLLRSISQQAILVEKDVNKHSAHLKATLAQSVSSRLWWRFCEIFCCSYCSCLETNMQHTLTAFQHMT